MNATTTRASGDSVAPDHLDATIPPGDDRDAALVLRLRKGDADAAERLVRRHARPLLRYLYRLSGSMQLAEELHQQTWASVMDHLDRLNLGAPGGFKTWLYRIATNKAIDHRRSTRHQRMARQSLHLFTDDAAMDRQPRPSPDPANQPLQGMIDALPDVQKQVLLMRHYSQMTLVEIAATLGCPLNVVLARLYRAMMKLRRLIQTDSR